MNSLPFRSGCAGFLRSAQSRRSFLQVGILGSLGLSLGDYLKTQALAAPAIDSQGPRKDAPAKNVIQIILPGGFSHHESWDPKPEAPIEYRGALGVVKTKIPGIVLSQNMQRTAQILDKLTVIRSVVGKIPDHAQSQYHIFTGYTPSSAIQHPHMGAIVSHELGGMNNLPAWIGVPRASTLTPAGTGYMAAKYGCFDVGADPGMPGFRVRDVAMPLGLSPANFNERLSLQQAVEEHFRGLETDGAALGTMDEFHRQAYALISSPKAQAAFTLDGESEPTRKLYGCGLYRSVKTGKPLLTAAERFMAARRLVEAGARFVTVQYGDWDTHTRINDTFNDAVPAFDHALAGLITDLEQRGLLDTTLVMVMTEFGRSAKVNATAGRDHNAKGFSMALAGGGITKGQIYGASDSVGAEPARDPVRVEDYLATCYWQLGIDSNKRLMAPGERPIDIVREGKVIKGLIA